MRRPQLDLAERRRRVVALSRLVQSLVAGFADTDGLLSNSYRDGKPRLWRWAWALRFESTQVALSAVRPGNAG
jgi:hypothetical protein